MKNIHVLPTDKPSRLWENWESKLILHPTITNILLNRQHIYITSDEEIKEGDWHLHYYEGKPVISKSYNGAVKMINEIAEQFSYKKVILTTDTDLINDGVQEINDGFLEWFVKNPSCEFINVDEKTPDEIKVELNIHGHDIGLIDREFDEWLNNGGQLYKIIIPKEEDFELVNIGEETIKLAIPMMQDKEENKQETLEEAAERLYPTTINSFTDSGFDMSETERLIFINGAKWQQEQDKNLYTEEDLREAFIAGGNSQIEEDDDHGTKYSVYMEEWFEKFKMK